MTAWVCFLQALYFVSLRSRLAAYIYARHWADMLIIRDMSMRLALRVMILQISMPSERLISFRRYVIPRDGTPCHGPRHASIDDYFTHCYRHRQHRFPPFEDACRPIFRAAQGMMTSIARQPLPRSLTVTHGYSHALIKATATLPPSAYRLLSNWMIRLIEVMILHYDYYT